MGQGDFLAKIKIALEGKEQALTGLNQLQTASQKFSQAGVKPAWLGRELYQPIDQIKEEIKGAGEETGKAAGKMGDFEKALRRVAIVAPVWMTFRAVIQEVMGILKDGFRTWEEFDRVLIKSKAVIHDFSGTTDQAMTELESTIRSFSKESGIALKDLAASFYRFGTVGIAFSDALSGAIASAKLAKATMGDVDTISRSLAMTYRLLGDTIDSTLSPMAKQESLAGKILHLWKTNAFEANEFSSSLNAFVSTANIANFTADQTIATLAALGTAGVMGSRGGTLLKTAIQKLVENLDILAPKLGLAVNPALENTFSLFMRVLGTINELSKTKGIPAEALRAIQEIFGGVRGGQVISALNALLPELTKNLEDLGRDPQKFIGELNDRFKEVTNTVSGQLDIFRRLREQVGEAFVKGIVGGKDFIESLQIINMLMEQAVIIAGNIPKAIRAIANPVEYSIKKIDETIKSQEEYKQKIKDTEEGLLSLADTIEFLSQEQQKWEKSSFGREVIQKIKEVIQLKGEQGKVQEEVNKAVDEYNKKHQEQEEIIDKTRELSTMLQNRLSLARKELENISLQKAGASELVVEHKKLEDLLTVMVKRYNNLTDASGKQVGQITTTSVKSALLSGNFEKVLTIFKEMILSEQEINSLADAYSNINKAVLADLDKRLSTMTSLLKIAGEDEALIIKQEMAMKALIFGEDYLKNSMDDRVRLAQALTKEADAQEKKSAHLVELFKIARKYGLEAAQEVAKFLGGTLQIGELSPEALRAVKKSYSGLFEAGKAEEFFKGLTFTFPEEIEKERIKRRNIQIINDIMIEPISLYVDIDSEEIIDKVKKKIIQALDDSESELHKKINEQIEAF